MMSRNADKLCFSASSQSMTPAELIGNWHVTVVEKKESHSKSKYL